MFTGLVEESGRVVASEIAGETARLTIAAEKVRAGAALGDSVAVNGCCLTVVAIDGPNLAFDAVPETMRRTNLGDLRVGDAVNLERPLLPTARLGGHFVQGHIDGAGVVRAITPEQNAVIFEIEVPPALRRYIIEKGSIAMDGISLTVASLTDRGFTVWIIPHTRGGHDLNAARSRRPRKPGM